MADGGYLSIEYMRVIPFAFAFVAPIGFPQVPNGQIAGNEC
jgi:hypothetical protein